MRCFLFSVVLLAFCANAKAQSDSALPTSKEERVASVKAAIIYQLLKYIEWPSNLVELRVCVYGDAQLFQKLKPFALRKFERRLLTIIEGTTEKSCDILYISSTNIKLYPQYKTSASRKILFLSDNERFIDKGGMIALVEKQGRVSLELNLQVLNEAGFQVSPLLTESAIRVIK